MNNEIANNVNQIIDKLSQKLDLTIDKIQPVTKEIIQQYQIRNIMISVIGMAISIALIYIFFKFILESKKKYIEKIKKDIDKAIGEKIETIKNYIDNLKEEEKFKTYLKPHRPSFDIRVNIDDVVFTLSKVLIIFLILGLLTTSLIFVGYLANAISPLVSILGL